MMEMLPLPVVRMVAALIRVPGRFPPGSVDGVFQTPPVPRILMFPFTLSISTRPLSVPGRVPIQTPALFSPLVLPPVPVRVIVELPVVRMIVEEPLAAGRSTYTPRPVPGEPVPVSEMLPEMSMDAPSRMVIRSAL